MIQNVILSSNVKNFDQVGTLLKLLLSQMSEKDAQKYLTQSFPRHKNPHFYADYWIDNDKQMNRSLSLNDLIYALSKRENLFDISESMAVGIKVSTKQALNCI